MDGGTCVAGGVEDFGVSLLVLLCFSMSGRRGFGGSGGSGHGDEKAASVSFLLVIHRTFD